MNDKVVIPNYSKECSDFISLCLQKE